MQQPSLALKEGKHFVGALIGIVSSFALSATSLVKVVHTANHTD